MVGSCKKLKVILVQTCKCITSQILTNSNSNSGAPLAGCTYASALQSNSTNDFPIQNLILQDLVASTSLERNLLEAITNASAFKCNSTNKFKFQPAAAFGSKRHLQSKNTLESDTNAHTLRCTDPTNSNFNLARMIRSCMQPLTFEVNGSRVATDDDPLGDKN